MEKRQVVDSVRRVLITGGTGALGQALVEAFARSGDDVVFTYKHSQNKSDEILNNLSDYSVSSHQLDTSSSDSIKQLIDEISTKWDGIDILINNAGIHEDKLLALMSDSQWESVIDINLTGVFRLIRSTIPLMLGQKGGRIINISSAAAQLALGGQANYAASKAGLESMSRVLSKELAKYSITVNCVAPGFLADGMTTSIDQKMIDHYLEFIPLKRFGQSREVVSVVKFLASKDASYITGSTIPVSGGL